MGILEFIFGIFVSVVLGVVAISIATIVQNTRDIEIENEKLKEDLKKARARKVKAEYKKVKEVK